MRITRPETPEKVPTQPVPLTWWYALRHYWFILLIVIAAAMAAGGLIYRGGYLRPVYTAAKYILSGQPVDFQALLPESVNSLTTNVKNEIRMYQDNGLSTLYLDIPFTNMEKIRKKRDEALQKQILLTTDDDFVSGTAHINQEATVDIKLRLKGDWTDHLTGDKWSLRIHTKDGALIDGLDQFSIQAPETRFYLLEWMAHKNLADEGIMVPRYSFVNVLINGEYKGIYAIEENFTKEMIETQGRRAGVILRFDEEPLWQNRAAAPHGDWDETEYFAVVNMSSADILAYSSKGIAASPALTEEARVAAGRLRAFQEGNLPASEVLDVQLWGRFFALSDLWMADHGVFWHNLRFYYNPITTLLEPVPYDLLPLEHVFSDQSVISDRGSMLTSFTNLAPEIFNDPAVRQAYAVELARIGTAGYLQDLANKHDKEYQMFKDALLEYSNQDVSIPFDELIVRTTTFQTALNPGQPVRGGFEINTSDSSSILQVELVNLMELPVEVIRFEVDKQVIPASTGQVDLEQLATLVQGRDLPTLMPVKSQTNGDYTPVRFTAILDPGKVDPLKTTTMQVVVRLAGLTREFIIPLTRHILAGSLTESPLPVAPSVQDLLAAQSFLRLQGDNTLTAVPGVWDVAGDLVIPAGMQVVFPAGVTLNFGGDNLFLSYSPLTFQGSEAAPILLTTRAETWPGLVVLNAGEPSLWQYTRVEKTRSIARNGWILTGGVTFYKSPITLEHAVLVDTQAEDDINTIHSPFIFRDSEFGNTASDAFDSDFSDGEISNCTFHDIGGDAVDTSGATVTIRDSQMTHIGDKGVSSGEQSSSTVIHVQMVDVGIGIASKDGSYVNASQVTIRHAEHTSMAAYTKKAVFGPGAIEASEVEITDTETISIVQIGSTLVLNGVKIQGVELDVKNLYLLGILGN